jgi:hypothetical protein
VNRPFYAFGVLLAFLTLGMLAIGLSSRPRGNQPGAGASSAARRQPGVTMYVVVLPEEESDLSLGGGLANLVGRGEGVDSCAICGLAGQPLSHSLGSGTNAACGNVFIKPTLWSGGWSNECAGSENRCPRFTFIELARRPPLETLGQAPVTGYDAAYDRAMAESVIAAPNAILPQAVDSATHFGTTELDQSDELVLLFDSLARCESTQRERELNPWRFVQRRWDYEARAIVLGTFNRLWRGVEMVRLDDDWFAAAQHTGPRGVSKANNRPGPTWAHYTAWIGSKQWTVVFRGVENRVTAPFFNPPRDELLQIAVAGLNRVAELLHNLAAQWLDTAGQRLARQPQSATVENAPK